MELVLSEERFWISQALSSVGVVPRRKAMWLVLFDLRRFWVSASVELL